AAEFSYLDHLEAHLRQQLRDELLELAGLHGQQTITQRLPNLVVVLFDLERQSAPHPLGQAHIATAVLNETRPLTAFLLAFDLGDHLGVHGGLGRFATCHQPSFRQGLLGDLLVVHRLLPAELLKHFLSTIDEGKARNYRWRRWCFFNLRSSPIAIVRDYGRIPKRKNLWTDLFKGRLVTVILDIGVESSTDSGRRSFSV